MSRRDPSTAAELVASGKQRPDGIDLATVKVWLRSAVVDNLALKAVAFLLALTLFILVHSDEDEIVTVSIKLFQATPREGLTQVGKTPDEVRVSIRGSRRKLRRLVQSKLEEIPVTLTNTGEFVFRSEMVRPLPAELEIVSFSPPSISLVFESTKDKSVAVRARTTGTVAAGYRIASVTTEPSRLDVRGAESAVARLEELVSQPVSIEGVSGRLEASVKLAVPPFPVKVVADGKPLAPQELEVSVIVDVVPAQGALELEIPVRLRAAPGVPGDVATSWTVEPAKANLTLRADQLTLDALDPSKLEVFAQVYPSDVVSRTGRRATVEVVGAPEGVAIEIKPRTLKLEPK